jgi:hypothetical protein
VLIFKLRLFAISSFLDAQKLELPTGNNKIVTELIVKSAVQQKLCRRPFSRRLFD